MKKGKAASSPSQIKSFEKSPEAKLKQGSKSQPKDKQIISTFKPTKSIKKVY